MYHGRFSDHRQYGRIRPCGIIDQTDPNHTSRCFNHLFISERSSKPQEIEISGRKISIKIANTRLSPTASWNEHIFVILFLSLLYKIMPFRRYRKAIIKNNERLRAIGNADFIGDVRGGDSFSDIYGVKGFLLGSIPSIIHLADG